MGWQGYQAHGPGAILIDADQAVTDPLWEGGITPGLYVSRSLLKEKGLDWPDPDIKRMVRQYDPQTEIVVEVLTGPDQDYYRFGVPGRTPAAAFAAVGAQLGEMALRPGELERSTKGKKRLHTASAHGGWRHWGDYPVIWVFPGWRQANG